jgi:hypothetical protein
MMQSICSINMCSTVYLMLRRLAVEVGDLKLGQVPIQSSSSASLDASSGGCYNVGCKKYKTTETFIF